MRPTNSVAFFDYLGNLAMPPAPMQTTLRQDHVFYLENGRLIGSDTFQALADTLPQFRQQIEFGQIQLRD